MAVSLIFSHSPHTLLCLFVCMFLACGGRILFEIRTGPGSCCGVQVGYGGELRFFYSECDAVQVGEESIDRSSQDYAITTSATRGRGGCVAREEIGGCMMQIPYVRDRSSGRTFPFVATSRDLSVFQEILRETRRS